MPHLPSNHPIKGIRDEVAAMRRRIERGNHHLTQDLNREDLLSRYGGFIHVAESRVDSISSWLDILEQDRAKLRNAFITKSSQLNVLKLKHQLLMATCNRHEQEIARLRRELLLAHTVVPPMPEVHRA